MRYDFAYAIDVFLRGVFRDYSAFSGRVSRRDFWHFCSISLALAVLSVLPGLVFPLLMVVNTVVWLGLLLPTAAMAVRRMHDLDRSGWWLVVPGVNLVFLCLSGKIGPNRFGSDPLGATIDAFA